MDLKVEFHIFLLFVIHLMNASIISLIPHQTIVKANMLQAILHTYDEQTNGNIGISVVHKDYKNNLIVFNEKKRVSL